MFYSLATSGATRKAIMLNFSARDKAKRGSAMPEKNLKKY
jgi:hypothetical protein